MENNRELTITRTFNAPRALVWKTWTDAKHIEQWWGPKGFTNPVCEWNARTGGNILIHMKAPDGNIYPMDGTFMEIRQPDQIIFTCAALDLKGNRLFEVLNTITFIAEGDKTKLVLHFIVSKITLEAAPHLSGMEEGWNMSLDKLSKYLLNLG